MRRVLYLPSKRSMTAPQTILCRRPESATPEQALTGALRAWFVGKQSLVWLGPCPVTAQQTLGRRYRGGFVENLS